MKIRIGIGAGRGSTSPEAMRELLGAIEDCGFDSIWFSESLTGGGLDPLVALSYAAAEAPRMKLGTTMLLPGRNPVRLAKALASIDALSSGHLLVTFVPGLLRSPEREAIGVAPRERGALIDEALPLLRELLSGAPTSHAGPLGTFEAVEIAPLPVQQPLEFWLGGLAAASLERCGRLGDGWLPSACTPQEAAAGKEIVDAAALRAGRQISPEHFGVSIAYLDREPTPREEREVAARAKGRDRALIVPVGMPEVRALLESFIAVGFSKFVLRPVGEVASWDATLALLAEGVASLQT